MNASLITLQRVLRRALGLAPLWAALATTAATAQSTNSAVVKTDQVRAELVLHAPQGLQPGAAAWLGLKIEHRPGWHTYWVNPGDSGLPTQLQWQLPEGWKAGAPAWPVPHKLPLGPLMNHGYEGTLLLASPLSVAKAPSAAPMTLRLRADWLVCKDVCIPEGGDFTLTVPAAAAQSSIIGSRALFEQALASVPVELPSVQGQARAGAQGLELQLTGLPAAWQGRKLHVFPEAPQLLAPAAEPQAQWEPGGAGRWAGVLTYDPQRSTAPGSMTLVLSPAQASKTASTEDPPGVRVTVAVNGPWPASDAATAAPPAPDSTVVAPTGAGGGDAAPASLWVSLAFALFGGLILNLMPCVFPVLSLKVFGFAQHAQDRRALAVGGLAYTLGVVLTFVALAGLLLALRASGEQLGWGFQLQSPTFVAGLCVLFALLGLNLLGQFELQVVLPGQLASFQARHPVIDHFATGVLAVVVASPCTAPFMGASLGAAVTMPVTQALAVFAALGLGLAIPYLLLSLAPALAARLPRPGAWMLVFKQSMALPMFATVIWLLWVLGHQVGVDALIGLLGVLIVLPFTIGAWKMQARTATRRAAFRFVGVGSLVATALWAWPALQEGSAEANMASGQTAAAASASGSSAIGTTVHWQAWSPQAVAELHRNGKTVFVDYTAAWCVTCQVNKRSTLRDTQVLEALSRKGVVTLRADWTRRDATITQELNRLQRTGVPVYAFYAPGTAPVLLPEVLTPKLVMDAVSSLP